MARNNYKAKWLAAINNSDRHPDDEHKELKENVDAVNALQINTTLQIKRIQHPMMEAARNATNLLSVMDEFSAVGALKFGPAHHMIDSKLGEMDMVLIARRLRDILKLAEGRIGMLSVAYEDACDKIEEIQNQTKSLKTFAGKTGDVLTELFIIGAKPTERERQDLEQLEFDGDYNRYNIGYEDRDDDWELTQLAENAVLRARTPRTNQHVEEDDEEDDSSDEDETTTKSGHRRADSAIALTHSRNRSAQIVPMNLADEMEFT